MKNLLKKYPLIILVSLFVVLYLYLRFGVSVWIFVFLVIDFVFAYIYKTKNKMLKSSYWSYTYLAIISLFLVSIFFVVPKLLSAKQSVPRPKMSEQECLDNAGKYDGKILKVMGEGVSGKIKIVANTKECRLEVHHLFVFTTELSQNPKDKLPYLYNYIGLIGQPFQKERKYLRSTGVITPIVGNVTGFPEDISVFSAVSEYFRNGDTGPQGVTPTKTFYSVFSNWENLNEQGYKSILSNSWYGVVDSMPYMYSEKLDNYGETYSTDTEKAKESGTIVKEFNFSITE